MVEYTYFLKIWPRSFIQGKMDFIFFGSDHRERLSLCNIEAWIPKSPWLWGLVFCLLCNSSSDKYVINLRTQMQKQIRCYFKCRYFSKNSTSFSIVSELPWISNHVFCFLSMERKWVFLTKLDNFLRLKRTEKPGFRDEISRGQPKRKFIFKNPERGVV